MHWLDYVIFGIYLLVMLGIDLLAGVFLKRRSNNGAFLSMVAGGAVTLTLILSGISLPFGLDANIYGIALAICVYLIFHFTEKKNYLAVKSAA